MKRILMVLLTAVSSIAAMAEIEWLSKEYDFGTFREAGGPITGSVGFINKGPEATFIQTVRPSCGCTGASFSQDMIQPGDTAIVSFTYNPLGRPGMFDKSIKVFVGPDSKLYTIKIKGTVIGAPATLENNYPYTCGPMRMDTQLLTTGEMKRGVSRHLFMNVYNESGDTIVPAWKSGDGAVSVDLAPRRIAPGEMGTFSFYIRSSEIPQNGPFEYPVTVIADSNDPHSEERTVDVSGIVVADASGVSAADLKTAPQAYLTPEFIDFGSVEEKDNLDFEFYILNEGKDVLSVDKVYSSQQGLIFSKIPAKIKGGKKGLVKGKFNTAGLRNGPFRIKIEIVTNDPLHPVRICNLVGEMSANN